MIDAGLSGVAVETAMASVGLRAEELSAILVTHEHLDHVQGVGILSRRHGIPVYANEPTWLAMKKKIGRMPAALQRFFVDEQDFYIGDISVQPYRIPHDAADPVGYCLYLGDNKKISIATDLGHTNASIIERLAGSDILLLEANHDMAMLLANPNYTQALKQRIRGNLGHLSNAQCAEAILALVPKGVRNIHLGHLSQENNVPALAYQNICMALAEQGVVAGQDVEISLTYRDRAGDMLIVR